MELKGCSLSWNSQNYHFPSFSGAGAGAQNSMEMLEQKQGQFWNLHRIPNKTPNPDFCFFFLD